MEGFKRMVGKEENKEERKKMRILVIRLSSIGDVLLTTPVLKAWKEKYPDSILDFVVLKQFQAAIQNCPYIDNIHIFDKKQHDGIKNIIKFSKKLAENQYDYVFDLHNKFRSQLMRWSMRVPYFVYPKRKWWKSILVNLGLISYQVDDTIIKNYFAAFRKFSLSYQGEDLYFHVSEEDKKKFESYRNFPVLAPGASKNTKKWPIENFALLAKLLYEKYSYPSILIGGKEDEETCQKIIELSGGKAISFAGKLSLQESGALLSQAAFLVSNDSGPFHIARGVKCPSFVIFGPTSPGMFELGKRDTLLFAGVDCSPCSLHGDKECPKKHFRCMKEITAEQILKNIEEKNSKEGVFSHGESKRKNS